MNWTELTSEAQVDNILEESKTQPVVIYKHSNRCHICAMTKDRLEREEPPEGVKFYFLDVLANRPVSNKVADVFHVHHESPQLLLIKNGECVYEESHNGIRMDELAEQLG
ncbi:MAG TPA: bacillithiol system redox-active protein YtxJ [Flavipsychrobacter sp.]|nr:bacillithiol system redox-active protein YtxJ [Flavipsychrobacter sp.]